jgi:hypothetical protein
VPEAKGRESFLAASTLLDQELKEQRPYSRGSALTWAKEQIRLQAVQHIRSLAGRPNPAFMDQVCIAIQAIDDVLKEPQ